MSVAKTTIFLIYVYDIPGSVDHAGLLKVGDASTKSPKKAFELTVNCAELKAAAKKRIDQQTGTAKIKYVLHHSELAVRRGGFDRLRPREDRPSHIDPPPPDLPPLLPKASRPTYGGVLRVKGQLRQLRHLRLLRQFSCPSRPSCPSSLSRLGFPSAEAPHG